MKRFLILLLCAALIAGVCGCKAKDGEPETTAAPEATEETQASATEAAPSPVPAATDAPAETEAPEETSPAADRSFLFCNGLGGPVTFEVQSAWTGWNGSYPVAGPFENVPSGVMTAIGTEELESCAEWENFGLVATDETGRYYYAWDVPLARYDTITLAKGASGYVYTVAHGDDTADRYDAITFMHTEPGDADERILHVNKLDFAGYEQAEHIFHDAFDLTTFEYQLTELDEADAEAYPELAAAIARDNEYRNIEIFYRANSFCDRVQHAEGAFQRGEWYMEAFVRRADSRLYSVLYRYTAVHRGKTVVDWGARNIDSKTGKWLELGDVVNDIAAFTDEVNRKLAEAGCESIIAVGDWTNDQDPHMPIWTLDHTGITVYVYDGGEGVTLFMPISEYYEIIGGDKYLPETENYTVAFPYGCESFFTVNGETVSVKITEKYNSTQYVVDHDAVYVEFNGETYRFEMMCLNGRSTSMYLFVQNGGRSYICILGNDSAESEELDAIEIANGRLYYMGFRRCEGSRLYVECPFHAGEYGYATSQITDPNNFTVEYWTSILGDLTVACPSGIAGCGQPHELDEVCTAPGYRFGMLCDLEAELVDETGKSLGPVTLTEGSEVCLIRTDRSTYVDLELEDGRVARVYVLVPNWDDIDWEDPDHPDWRPSVDGVPVDEIFDGVYWI